MKPEHLLIDRRAFMMASAGIAGLTAVACNQPASALANAVDESLFVIGPIDGYSPLVGTLVSMLNYNRSTVIKTVNTLLPDQLDYLHDPKANTIGALIMHLGATEKYYQANTFEGRQEYSAAEKKMWGAAMELGDDGRKHIKGHDVEYYLNLITEVRQKTLEEFKKKDDQWLLAVDPAWSTRGSLNTYWKWFHVCEHESNHRGQITWLKRRLPGAEPDEK